MPQKFLLLILFLQIHTYSVISLPVSSDSKTDKLNIAAQERKDDTEDVLSALNLPADFLSGSAKNAETATKKKNTEPSAQASDTSELYTTGNDMIDAIMNCPCQKEDLDAVGLKGEKWTGAVHLKAVGGTTGSVFGQLIRLTLGLPRLAIGVAQPIVVGSIESFSQAAGAAAGAAKSVAKNLPNAAVSGGVLAKRLVESAGLVTGGLLETMANIVASFSGAGNSISGSLPFIFDILGGVTEGFGKTIGTVLDWVTGTLEILSTGVIEAAKTKGSAVGNLVEGGKDFKTGLLEGIKAGVTDEELEE